MMAHDPERSTTSPFLLIAIFDKNSLSDASKAFFIARGTLLGKFGSLIILIRYFIQIDEVYLEENPHRKILHVRHIFQKMSI